MFEAPEFWYKNNLSSKIKIILFEPNIVLGRSNKVILKYANKIICYHDKIINFPKIFYNKIMVINNLMRK